MSLFIPYLIKLSVSLGIVWLFYQVVLRRLTFYNWNRWYLLGYSLLSFLIPFIDISPVLQENEWSDSGVVQWVPMIGGTVTGVTETEVSSYQFTTWNLISLILVAGMLFFFARLIIQLLSFRKMVKKAKLLHAGATRIYQVEGDIIPFSFGNSIFINRHLHTEDELREIISHEFVHVKQGHSMDIILGELLCLLNWYNPFAWLLRRSIRQNLEFIADDKVLQYGIDPKQYQYLLLKVIGNNQFSIAPKFNFSSLKKRIAMMNKMKSAGVHIVKFLFILPFVAVLLIAFRNSDQRHDTAIVPGQKSTYLGENLKRAVFTDTVPLVNVANSKGNYINIKGVDGHCVVVVTDKKGKEVERVLLTEWNENEEKFENKYGEILPPPLPVEAIVCVPPMPPGEAISFTAAIDPILSIDAIFPIEAVVPTPALNIIVKPCIVMPADTTPLPATIVRGTNPGIVTDWEINDKKAVIRLKNGETEEYDLTNAIQKKKFEDKYGRIINLSKPGPDALGPVAVIGSRSGSPNTLPPVTVISSPIATTAIAGHAPAPDGEVLVIDALGHTINGNEDILFTITKNTTREQLEEFKKEMKSKGIELNYDEIDYDGGKLVRISGTMKSGGSTSSFVGVDFEKLILAMVKKGDRTYFKVSSRDDKRVI